MPFFCRGSKSGVAATTDSGDEADKGNQRHHHQHHHHHHHHHLPSCTHCTGGEGHRRPSVIERFRHLTRRRHDSRDAPHQEGEAHHSSAASVSSTDHRHNSNNGVNNNSNNTCSSHSHSRSRSIRTHGSNSTNVTENSQNNGGARSSTRHCHSAEGHHAHAHVCNASDAEGFSHAQKQGELNGYSPHCGGGEEATEGGLESSQGEEEKSPPPQLATMPFRASSPPTQPSPRAGTRAPDGGGFNPLAGRPPTSAGYRRARSLSQRQSPVVALFPCPMRGAHSLPRAMSASSLNTSVCRSLNRRTDCPTLPFAASDRGPADSNVGFLPQPSSASGSVPPPGGRRSPMCGVPTGDSVSPPCLSPLEDYGSMQLGAIVLPTTGSATRAQGNAPRPSSHPTPPHPTFIENIAVGSDSFISDGAQPAFPPPLVVTRRRGNFFARASRLLSRSSTSGEDSHNPLSESSGTQSATTTALGSRQQHPSAVGLHEHKSNARLLVPIGGDESSESFALRQFTPILGGGEPTPKVGEADSSPQSCAALALGHRI